MVYNKFIIYEPKERLIVSQNIQDKIVNHLVARHILYPAILPCLLDVNVASRKNMGTSKGLEISNKSYEFDLIRFFSSISFLGKLSICLSLYSLVFFVLILPLLLELHF